MNERVTVKKTTKLFIGGAFPRTESGRSMAITGRRGEVISQVCLGSKKDFRNAVVAANKGFSSWRKATPFLRSQILYRAAEMLEDRRASFVQTLREECLSPRSAEKEVDAAIDLLVSYAGWCDKFQGLFSTVNPVASSHYNFSVPEASGVIALVLGEGCGFADMVEGMGRLLAGGNSLVCLAPQRHSISAISLAEVWLSSDLPAGVINILTGDLEELATTIASHGDLEGLLGIGVSPEQKVLFQREGAEQVKRISFSEAGSPKADPYGILSFTETKTTWHPVGG